MPTNEALSVVYPTRNRPEMIVRSLRALLDNSELPEQIVVVDQSHDNSTRDAIAALDEPTILQVPSTQTGLSNSRNTGIAASVHPIVGFIDDDCFPARNWVATARRIIHEHPDSMLWIGQDYPDAKAIAPEALANSPERTFSLRGAADPWRVGPTGGNCFFRRTTFDAVGTFDPLLGQGGAFPGAEDGDMVYRVLKQGLQVTYSDAIRVHHYPWRSDGEDIDNNFNYGLGVGAMLAKHLAQRDVFPLFRIFPRRFLPCYFGVVANFLLRRRRRMQVSLGWSRSIVAGFLGWRRHQREVGRAVA